MHPTPKLAYWLLFLSLCWDTWQAQAREECALACRLKVRRDRECECKAPGVGGSRLQVTRVGSRTDEAGALLPVFFLVSLRSLSPPCATACLQGGSLWSHVSVSTLTNMPKGVFIPNSVKFRTQTLLAPKDLGAMGHTVPTGRKKVLLLLMLHTHLHCILSGHSLWHGHAQFRVGLPTSVNLRKSHLKIWS